MYKLEMIGFDARELWLDSDSQWDKNTHNTFLLRREVLKPLSVDRLVWYSVFTEKTISRIWENKLPQSIYFTDVWNMTFSEKNFLQTPPDKYLFNGIWRNLNTLNTYLQEHWQDDWKPCAIIAIQEIINLETFEDDEDNSFLPPIVPNEVQDDWVLLGYDVADYYLYSGLADGGIQDELFSKIKPEWVDNLNDYHLFTNPQTAFDYIEFANARIPTHQPFYVYALYLVKSVRALLPKR